MYVELLGVEEAILHEIENKDYTRDNVALTYSFCILSNDEIDFGEINRAIAARWSRSALEYIKRKAWKIVEGK